MGAKAASKEPYPGVPWGNIHVSPVCILPSKFLGFGHLIMLEWGRGEKQHYCLTILTSRFLGSY